MPLSEVLPAVCPLVSQWLCLSMANPKVPLDPSLLLLAHHSKVCVEDSATEQAFVIFSELSTPLLGTAIPSPISL